MSNTIVEYAGKNDATIQCDNSSPFICKSIIRNNRNTIFGTFYLVRSSLVIAMCNINDNGRVFYLSFSDPLIEYNNIIGNSGNAIYCFRSQPIVRNNNIINNLPFAIYIKDGSYVDAANNWWGTNDTAEINEMIYDYYDDITLGEVVFLPHYYQLIDFTNMNVNKPPTANAGPDQIIFDTITLDGSLSSDPEGDPITYEWNIQHTVNPDYNYTATGQQVTITGIATGFYDVTLTVTDSAGAIDTDTMFFSATGLLGDFDFDGDVDGDDLAAFSENFGM